MSDNKFVEELQKLNITVNKTQMNQLEQYYAILCEWNEKMNLTGITEKKAVYLKHFYDSATLQRAVDLNKEESLCDIGTGAGFPGLVLKILFPHLHVVLVDSLNKRIGFLDYVIESLKLENIKTVHARAEDYAKKNIESFDVVTCRAVAKLNVLSEYCVPMVKIGKYFTPMKGNIAEEIKMISGIEKILAVKLVKIEEFVLPEEQSQRTIVVFQKKTKTNHKYPRKYSEMQKSPL